MPTDNFQSRFSATGHVNLKLYNRDGVLIAERSVNNLITNDGRSLMLYRYSGLGIYDSNPEYVAIGTGTTPPSVNDTTITPASSLTLVLAPPTLINTSNNVGGTTSLNNDRLVYQATFAAGNGIGDITEAGIFTGSSTSYMLFARTTFDAITKSAGDELVITWRIAFANYGVSTINVAGLRLGKSLSILSGGLTQIINDIGEHQYRNNGPVTIASQPSGQLCIVDNYTITCADTYTVGGVISGLRGGNVVLTMVNVYNGVSTTRTVSVAKTSTAWKFSAGLLPGTTYSVTCTTAGYTVSVAHGSGTVGTSDVNSVRVEANSNSLFAVTGLASGQTMVAKSGTTTITVTADGVYSLDANNNPPTILMQPSTQTCTVSGKTITCVNTYTIGGTIDGTISATNPLLFYITATTPAGDTTTFSKIVTNTYPTWTTASSFVSGTTYTITCNTAGYTISIANAIGTIGTSNVTNANVTVTADNMFRVTGLGSGKSVVVRSGTQTTTVAANGTYPLDANNTTPTVLMQPNGQDCTVSTIAGKIITCVYTYTVSGTVSGLTQTGLVIQLNVNGTAMSSRTITANATSFSISTGIYPGSTYEIVAISTPTGTIAVITNGSGTITNANVTDVNIAIALI